MRRTTLAGATLAAILTASYLGATAADEAGGYIETDLVVNKSVNGVPTLTDKNGVVHNATFFDPNLQNAWGLTESPTSPFWVSDNGSGKTTLYNTPGMPQSLVVSIPSPSDPLGASGTPTGAAFNPAQAQKAFTISGVGSDCETPASAPARFLFATEDGTIVGWNPGVNPAGCDRNKAGTYGIIAVDNSSVTHGANGAVYKGLAIATTGSGGTFLYATNFRGGTVQVYDANFAAVTSFTDPDLPRSYAPFNVVLIAGELFVTFAVQDAAKHDDVAGQGHGIVDTFDLAGQMLRRFVQHGQLDSPWGVALAPPGFGELGGALWIGNFGNGHINAFDPRSGEFLDKVRQPKGQALVIDGLWALKFGNGGNGGNTNTLYFTAGPNDEADGLFGGLNPN